MIEPPSPSPLNRPKVGGYELLHSLGRGGMGTVWLARHERTGQRVALKLINSAEAADSERFLTEARAGSRLQHANIVRVLHFGTADGQPFFTMELLFGGSLRDRLRRGPLVPRDAARLVRQAADAIQYAHEHQVLHRDLTPANLMLAGPDWETNELEPECVLPADDASLSVKVCDFGLARLQDATQHQTRTGDQIGTPPYMSPEQARGDMSRVGERTDVYGLGAVLYACLTGRPPFQAATPVETLWQVWHRDPVPVRALVPGVPRELEAVCLKCLEKDPRRRYGSAKELADDLGRWLDGKPVLARPAGFASRAAKWARRNAVVASLTTAALLALVVGVVASSYFAVSAGREAKAANQAQGEANNALAESRRQLGNAERALYVGQLAQAQREFAEGNATRALEILGQCKPELRHVEHHLLWSSITARRTLAERAGVFALACSPVGRRLAVTNSAGEVHILDAATGAELVRLPGLGRHVSAIAFSPDGDRLATAVGQAWAELHPGPPAAVQVWDAATGRELLALRGHTSAVTGLAFRPDGLRLASCGADSTVRVWDLETGGEILTLRGHKGIVRAVAYSPDGDRLLTGGNDHRAQLWDAESGLALRSDHERHIKEITAVAFAPDGKQFLTADSNRFLIVWDAESFTPLHRLAGPADGFRCATFSPDGARVAAGSHDGVVRVWDARDGRPAFSLKGHSLPVCCVAFTPDGQTLFSGSGDPFRPTRPGAVKFWDAIQGQGQQTLTGHQERVKAVAFSPDGQLVASASCDMFIKLWDARLGREVRELRGHRSYVADLAFSPDGRRLVSVGADKLVKVWEVATGRPLAELSGHSAALLAVAFAPDGRRVASACEDQTAVVWDLESGRKLLTLRHPRFALHGVAFSPDGSRLLAAAGRGWLYLAGDVPGEVVVWDSRTGDHLLTLTGHADGVICAGFSPDGKRILSGGLDRVAKVWDAETGQCLASLVGHALPVTCVAFSPDGRRLLTGGGDYLHSGKPGELKLWDAERGQMLLSLTGHREAVSSVAFDRRGTRLVTGSWDRTVRLWDARPAAGN